MLYIFKYILIVVFFISSFAMILFVLLQRGEEGVFAKNRSDRISTDNNTLIRTTVICSLVFFISAFTINGLIYYEKHSTNKTTVNVIEIKK